MFHSSNVWISVLTTFASTNKLPYIFPHSIFVNQLDKFGNTVKNWKSVWNWSSKQENLCFFLEIIFWKFACKSYFWLCTSIHHYYLVLQHCKSPRCIDSSFYSDQTEIQSVWKWNKSVTMQCNEKWSTNVTPYHAFKEVEMEIDCKSHLTFRLENVIWIKYLPNPTYSHPTHNKWGNVADYVQDL